MAVDIEKVRDKYLEIIAEFAGATFSDATTSEMEDVVNRLMNVVVGKLVRLNELEGEANKDGPESGCSSQKDNEADPKLV